MNTIIHAMLLIAVANFLISLVIKPKNERWLSGVAIAAVGANVLLSVGLAVYWLLQGGKPFNLKDATVYHSSSYNLFIDFFFDKTGAVYAIVGSIISFLVVVYSRYYMHKDEGFKRFYNTVAFFYIGYLVTIFAGNFETLFVGWELLGISSFLLIAFYRLRYIPIKNAIKVFSIYRIGDIGILLAMWMSHHLWHDNVTFYKLQNYELVHEHLATHTGIGIFISLMILVAALAKSAQLPFSAWLPRAMEGPTPSSAIFYGSLSVHIGVFLLLRTHPFWEHQLFTKVLIVVMGLLTAAVTTMTARVQPTVKGQIAYSSAAQIGLIFVEVALGFEVLALFHFAGNAFLRTYQLLVSPSVASYLVREQFYNYVPTPPVVRPNTPKTRLYQAVYLMSLKEWNLDSFIFRLIFKPLKSIRHLVNFLTMRNILLVVIPTYLIGIYLASANVAMPDGTKETLAIVAGFMAFGMVAKAYNERTSSRLAWLLAVFSHFFVDLAVSFNDHLDLKEATIYLSGIVVAGALGYFVLHRIKALEGGSVGLNQFHGLVTKYPRYAFLFLAASLGVAGFPITTAFLGEDLVLTHIHEEQVLLAALVSITFIINGIALIRLYARVFLGKIYRNYQTANDLTA